MSNLKKINLILILLISPIIACGDSNVTKTTENNVQLNQTNTQSINSSKQIPDPKPTPAPASAPVVAPAPAPLQLPAATTTAAAAPSPAPAPPAHRSEAARGPAAAALRRALCRFSGPEAAPASAHKRALARAGRSGTESGPASDGRTAAARRTADSSHTSARPTGVASSALPYLVAASRKSAPLKASTSVNRAGATEVQ